MSSHAADSMIKLRKVGSTSRVLDTSRDFGSEGNLPIFGSQINDDTSPTNVRSSNLSLGSQKSRRNRNRFLSSRRVGEQANTSVCYDDISGSGGSVSSSISDPADQQINLFENMESLDLIPKVAKRKSILVKIPRDIVNMEEDEKEESKSQENQQAADLNLFSLNDSVFNLIRRYKRKWRLLYDIH